MSFSTWIDDSPAPSRRAETTGLFLLAVALATVSWFSTGLRYDHANSGRYLLQVLKSADPELFVQDSVVDSLARFRSLFYDMLAAIFGWVRAPHRLEEALSVLYLICRVSTTWLVMAIGRALGGGLVTAFLLGCWCSFEQTSVVGGDSLFANVMTHATVAFLTAAGALLLLLEGHERFFWPLLGLTLFIHPLIALHLALCIVPALFAVYGPTREHWLGCSILGGCLILYWATLAPPPMSSAEAAIFLEAKKDMVHVSAFAQSTLAWTETAALMALVFFVGFKNPRQSADRRGRLLAVAMFCGGLAAVTLSFGAAYLDQVRLAQLQPLRLFVWVQFFAFVVLAGSAGRAAASRSMPEVLLFTVFLFSILPTRWRLAFLGLTLLYFVALRLRLRDLLARAAFIGIVAAMTAGWFLRDTAESIDSLRNPWVPAVGILLLPLVSRWPGRRLRTAAAVVILGVALSGGAVYWHRYFDAKSYPEWGSVFRDRAQADWTAVRQRIAASTPKQARFVLACGGQNFRTRALRTGLGEPMSALAWVDPAAYDENERRRQEIERGRRSGAWDLEYLVDLARSWGADHLLVEGETSPTPRPRFEIGPYRVFRVDELRMDLSTLDNP